MRRILIILFFSVFEWCTLCAQNIHFNRLGPAQGLSHFSVSSIYQDEHGMMWFATRMGLNSWDGSTITTYAYEAGMPGTLFSNTVQTVTGDGHGHLYLKCAGGLAVMNLATRRFTTLVNGNIGAMYYSDRLYYSMGSVLYAVMPSGQRRIALRLPDGVTITRIMTDSRRRMWIGTERHGVFMVSKGIRRHLVDKGRVETFYEDGQHNIYIGTWYTGFYKVNPKGVMSHHGSKDGYYSNFFRAFAEDVHGNMWMGTADGLVRWQRNDGKISLIRAGELDGQLSDKSVWCITKDSQGTLWIGTYFGGVCYANPTFQIFTHYRKGQLGQSISSNVVGRMTEDNEHRLWICTEGGGLNMLDRRKGTFSLPMLYSSDGDNTLNLKAVCFDHSANTLWVGTHLGGLAAIDLTTKVVRRYVMREDDPNSIPSNIVRDIIVYNGRIIVGTQSGVAILNPATSVFTRLMPQENIDYVSSICTDKQHQLWIATEGKGLWMYNLDNGRHQHYSTANGDPNRLGTDNLNHVMTDRQGRIWIATSGNGILMKDANKDVFVQYGEKEHLSGNAVYAMATSTISQHRLLLITNKGFSIFDETRKRFDNYTQENGFPLSTANEQALYVAPDGLVCIGGVDGLYTFMEKSLSRPMPRFRLYFSRLFINGKEVQPQDDNGVLDVALPYTDQITLADGQRTFSIRIGSTNSIEGNGGEVYYRLRGYKDQWTRLPVAQHTLSFIGLPSGSYVLEVRSTVNGVPDCSLDIRILPPWYMSWWAYAVYALLIIVVVRMQMRGYRRRIRLREQLHYHRERMAYVEQMNRSKVETFTNISHEIRTPLTVIVALAESLLKTERFSSHIYNKVLGIYKNSTQLRTLITELLDFRKQEEGKMQIKAVELSLSQFMLQSVSLFKEYAQAKGVRMLCDAKDDTCIWADLSLMRKVMNNLLSNAIKHTPKGGTVTVRAGRWGDEAVISVHNVGDGIAQEEIERVFENFYQTENFKSLRPGTGIGLSLSKSIVEAHHGQIMAESRPGEGATFTVRLPLGNSHFEKWEMADEAHNETVDYHDIQLPLPQAHEVTMESEAEEADNRNVMLVVEDNDEIRALLVQILSPYYSVLTAVNGKDALEQTQNAMPDIVLSDVLMPVMSGIELCKAIKSDMALCHIPVVLLTARTDEEANIEGLKIGADDYITKPFKTSLLISRCNNIVNTRRMLQRKFAEQPMDNVELVANNPIDKKMMEQAMRIIEDNYANPDFNVNDFAREIGMSRTALFNKWKHLTGSTPKSFILNLRLRKAAEMLRTQQHLTITSVSYRNGFSSPKYFCKCFKEYFKVQPSTYRRRMLAGSDEDGNKNELK